MKHKQQVSSKTFKTELMSSWVMMAFPREARTRTRFNNFMKTNVQDRTTSTKSSLHWKVGTRCFKRIDARLHYAASQP